MNSPTLLEKRLVDLIGSYREVRAAKRRLENSLSENQAVIRELEGQNRKLRERVDALDRDRFTLRRLKEERQTLRRQLESALHRLTDLEGRLS